MQSFILTQNNNLWFGSFPLLSEAGAVNACSCRLHGTSDLVEDTLNLALHVGDNQGLVLRNRQLFAGALGVDHLRFTTCQQVHGSRVAVVDGSHVGAGAISLDDTIKDADALVTNVRQLPLLLFFADCVPVLLYDPVQQVIGLAHAGWRGTVAGIAAKTVQAMQKSFGSKPENILAAIGPSIGQCCYEVDDYVRLQAAGYEQFFVAAREKGHYLLDLWGYNAAVLQEAGLASSHIAIAGVCTAHNHRLFCSYRSENGKTGRMGVCLMLP